MPSTYTTSLRLEMQASGENLNTWGTRLNNAAINRIDFSIAGLSTIALTGNYTLTSSNVADDQARSAFLKFTGTGAFVVTIPSVSKSYVVWNACTGAVTVTTGGGQTASVQPGEIVGVLCDGTNVNKIKPANYDGAILTGLGTPLASSDAATKGYVDGVAFGSVNLPGQGPGTVGAMLWSDGTVANWQLPTPDRFPLLATKDSPAFTGVITYNGSSKSNVAAPVAEDLDLSAAALFVKSISATTTFTFSNLPVGDDDGMAFVVRLTISSGAGHNWPASVKWPNNVKPALPNGTHVIGFLSFDDGASWNALVGGTGYP